LESFHPPLYLLFFFIWVFFDVKQLAVGFVFFLWRFGFLFCTVRVPSPPGVCFSPLIFAVVRLRSVLVLIVPPFVPVALTVRCPFAVDPSTSFLFFSWVHVHFGSSYFHSHQFSRLLLYRLLSLFRPYSPPQGRNIPPSPLSIGHHSSLSSFRFLFFFSLRWLSPNITIWITFPFPLFWWLFHDPPHPKSHNGYPRASLRILIFTITSPLSPGSPPLFILFFGAVSRGERHLIAHKEPRLPVPPPSLGVPPGSAFPSNDNTSNAPYAP